MLYSHNIKGGPSTVSVNSGDIPKNISLSQNYPNPFNPNTLINYRVNEPGNVILTVYNLMGQRVETLVNETKSAGEYSVIFNGTNLSSGIYYYSLRSNNSIVNKKCLLLK